MKKQLIYYGFSFLFFLSTSLLSMEKEKYSFEKWKEIHKHAKNGDHESAYKLGLGWSGGDMGLKQNTYKAIIVFLCAKKSGNQEVENELKKIFELHYENALNNQWVRHELSGASIFFLGMFLYKGVATERDYNKAYLCFDQLQMLNERRKKEAELLQKKWLLGACIYQGVSLYNGVVDAKYYDSCESFYEEEKENMKFFIRCEKAKEYFTKALNFCTKERQTMCVQKYLSQVNQYALKYDCDTFLRVKIKL